MTETEYVKAIRDSASAYVSVVRDPEARDTDGKEIIRRWWTMKENLSAHQVIKLCDLWLEKASEEGK